MTETLRLLFSHLFWMRSLKEKIISNFIFEFIEHKVTWNATKTKNISFRWIWCAKNFNVQYLLHHAFDLTHFCSVEKRLSDFIIWLVLIFIICCDAEHLNCKILKFFWSSNQSFSLRIEYFDWWNHLNL